MGKSCLVCMRGCKHANPNALDGNFYRTCSELQGLCNILQSLLKAVTPSLYIWGSLYKARGRRQDRLKPILYLLVLTKFHKPPTTFPAQEVQTAGCGCRCWTLDCCNEDLVEDTIT